MRTSLGIGLAVVVSGAAAGAADEAEFGGKPVSAWVKALNDKKTRRDAIDALGSIGPEAKSSVQRLTQFLTAKVNYDRSEVARVKQEELDRKEAERKKAAMPKNAKTPVRNPADVKIEQDRKKREEEARLAAAGAVEGVTMRGITAALVKIAAKDEASAKTAVTAILGAVESYDDLKEGGFRADAVECVKALEQFGPNAKPAVNALVKYMGGAKGQELADAAGSAVAKIDPGNDAAVKLLIKRAQDKDERISLAALASLKNVGKEAKEALPVLKQIKESAGANSRLAQAAEEAIKAIEQ